MASTQNLQSTVAWCAPLLRFSPQLTGSLEPSLTNANLVKQTILGAPFIWRQNRNAVTFATTTAAQDYQVAIPDFGFLETVSLAALAGPGGAPPATTFEVENATSIASSSEQLRPTSATIQGDDNQGNFVVRLSSVPDQVYQVTLVYQKKAAPMTSMISLWSPLPDELGYIYNWGYLAMAAMVQNDARFVSFNARFVAHLLGAQDGLSDLARNIFLANWTAVQAQAQRAQGQTAQAVQARGQS